MFGVKDSVLREPHTCVAYKFLCAGRNTCYVGETSRHLSRNRNKPLSCLLWALRWVVNGARKSFSGHLLWFFTYDQLGNRRISDAHTRKILLYLLQRTS